MSTSCWSDLPDHLSASIAKFLDIDTDLRRFRAVCSAWRSSVRPPKSPFCPLPLKLPFPLSSIGAHGDLSGFFALSHDTVYLLQPPGDDEFNAGTSQSELGSSRQGWLVRVREDQPGRFHVFSPVSKSRIYWYPETFPRYLNLLNFRVTEVTKIYSIRFVDRTVLSNGLFGDHHPVETKVSKVTVSGNPVTKEARNCIVFAIHGDGALSYFRLSDERWTIIDPRYFYRDIAIRNEQLYAIDNGGKLLVFDSCFEIVKIIPSPLANGNRDWLHLVESSGDLLLVVFPKLGSYQTRTSSRGGYTRLAIRVDVFKLKEEEGRWVLVRDLGDRILFVGDECNWSVSAKDFAGSKGNCIYFHTLWLTTHFRINPRLRGISVKEIGVYDLQDRIAGPLISYPGYSDLFWPPPTWLS